MVEVNFHYAVQVCDTLSYQNPTRYCGPDRTLLSKKSLRSFFYAVKGAAELHPKTLHTVMLLTDNISENLKAWVDNLKSDITNIKIFINHQKNLGIADSIETCYNWLSQEGKDFVYQVQDDYIFRPYSIIDMTNTWYRIYNETKTKAIISPYNDPNNWNSVYRNRPTPRTIFFGDNGYYIQLYDLSCSFLWVKNEFVNHWDLYKKFFELTKMKSNKLESESLNKMLVYRGILAVCPIRSLALHMQTETEKDPYIDWKTWWESIQVD
jgi:hypothetical protein